MSASRNGNGKAPMIRLAKATAKVMWNPDRSELRCPVCMVDWAEHTDECQRHDYRPGGALDHYRALNERQKVEEEFRAAMRDYSEAVIRYQQAMDRLIEVGGHIYATDRDRRPSG